MKMILINASPRKNGNTAQLLKSAQKGALEAGAETEYVDLFDLTFTGCRSCLACKRKGMKRCHCYWKDDLSPLLDRIFEADALIIGCPVYFGDITASLQALLERLQFCCMSYDDYSNYFTGHVKTGVILTMNAPESMYEAWYREAFTKRLRGLGYLNGGTQILPSCDTLQVDDYSKYNMGSFNESHKRRVHQTEFPRDLEKAYSFGKQLVSE